MRLNRSSATRSRKTRTLITAEQDEQHTAHSANVVILEQWVTGNETYKMLCLSSVMLLTVLSFAVFRHNTDTQLGFEVANKEKQLAIYRAWPWIWNSLPCWDRDSWNLEPPGRLHTAINTVTVALATKISLAFAKFQLEFTQKSCDWIFVPNFKPGFPGLKSQPSDYSTKC